MVADWGHDSETILLSLSPLSHHIATVAIAQATTAGMELVVNSPPPGKTPLDWIVATGATYVMGGADRMMDILAELRRRNLAHPDEQQLGAVKTFYMAGSVIPRRGRPWPSSIAASSRKNVYGMRENKLAPIHAAERQSSNT